MTSPPAGGPGPPMLKPLRLFKLRDRFRAPWSGAEGVVQSIDAGCATVRFGAGERTIVTAEGETVTVPVKRTLTWSLATMLEPLQQAPAAKENPDE